MIIFPVELTLKLLITVAIVSATAAASAVATSKFMKKATKLIDEIK